MRIVAGTLGGRRLVSPRGDAIRPTSELVREALLNRLGDQVGRAWLDLCAGTGAVGLEAHSRGASPVVFVERDRAALALLGENLRGLGLDRDPGLRVERGELERVLPRLVGAGLTFDVVFVDPPWAQAEALFVAVLDAFPRLARPGAVLVLEHRKQTVVTIPPGLALVDLRRYGDTALTTLTLAPPG